MKAGDAAWLRVLLDNAEPKEKDPDSPMNWEGKGRAHADELLKQEIDADHENQRNLNCQCNTPGTATHVFGDQRWCWASGAMPIPEWIQQALGNLPADIYGKKIAD